MAVVKNYKIEWGLFSVDKFIGFICDTNQNNCSEGGIYPKSINHINGGMVFMVDEGNHDILVAVGGDFDFEGTKVSYKGHTYVKAHLNHNNAVKLRELFPFTAPTRVLTHNKTLGVGDRLGIACPGHIHAFEQYNDTSPIFAQQSIRELNLTNRTYDDVLDCVSFSVFREGFKCGFGADGDHLKKPEEIEYALNSGYTMITLDCSEHIRNDIEKMSEVQVKEEYKQNEELESLYLNKAFDIGEGVTLKFDELSYKRAVLIYIKAIDFAEEIFNNHIKCDSGLRADLEISIDETLTPTSPLQHFFVANELRRRKVKFATIAPRFCGEFQKGIDYIGDLDLFETEFKIHAVISRHFGYKLSIHSGSDKFSVFPIIGKYTNYKFHLKTAGTNWLEAMKLVAVCEPSLYREIHEFALRSFNEAIKYYHVTTNLENIPKLSDLDDSQLPELFSQNDSRQLIHITYGLILSHKNADGSFAFRDRLYKIWRKHARLYAEFLEIHIGHHIQLISGL
jgi:hypothetical protein